MNMDSACRGGQDGFPSWPPRQAANRTSMTNTYCVYTVLRYYLWWTVDLSETCRLLYQVNLRKCASRWLLLQEYSTMHGPLNVKFAIAKQFKDSFLFKPTRRGRQNPYSVPLQFVQMWQLQWQWDMIFFEHFGTNICQSNYHLQKRNTKRVPVHATKAYGGVNVQLP